MPEHIYILRTSSTYGQSELFVIREKAPFSYVARSAGLVTGLRNSNVLAANSTALFSADSFDQGLGTYRVRRYDAVTLAQTHEAVLNGAGKGIALNNAKTVLAITDVDLFLKSASNLSAVGANGNAVPRGPVAFSPDGTQVYLFEYISGTSGNKFGVYNATNAASITSHLLSEGTHIISEILPHPDNNRVFLLTARGLRIYNRSANTLSGIVGTPRAFYKGCFNADGSVLIASGFTDFTSSADKTATFRINASTYAEIQVLSADWGRLGMVLSATSGHIIASGTNGGVNFVKNEEPLTFFSKYTNYPSARGVPNLANTNYKFPITIFSAGNPGSESGGYTRIVSCEYAQDGATVTFDGIEADVSTYSANTGKDITQIVLTVPAHAPGYVDVTIVNPDGSTATLENGFRYLASAPVITSIEPDSGTTSGGTAFSVEGTAFQSGDIVKLDGVNATSIIVVSDTEITGVTPAHSSGAVDVSVHRPSTSEQSVLVSGFNYILPAPTITSFSPASGPVETLVTINGTNLGGVTTAKAYNNQVATVLNNTSTQVVIEIPAGATTGVLTLVTPQGTAISSDSFTVTEDAPDPPVLDPDTAYITFKKTGDTYHTLQLPALPEGATSWKLFTGAGVLIIGGLPGASDYDRSSLTPGTTYVYLLKASNSAGDSGFNEPDSITTNLFSSGGVSTPAKPDTPDVSKDCDAGNLVVLDSDWEESDSVPITSSGLRRRINGGDWEVLAPDWDAAGGNYIDSDVSPLDVVEYSVNRTNGVGSSEWSDASEIALESSTLSLAWQSPGAESILTGKVVLRFQAADAGGVQNLQVFVRGALLATAPARKIGTSTNGTYILTLDTRRAGQGVAVIAIQGLGSDGCLAREELSVTFANSRHSGVRYRDFISEEALSGNQIERFPLSLALGELDTDPTHQYYGQIAITSNMSVPIITSETPAADAQEAFDGMQPVPMLQTKSWPRMGAIAPGSILFGAVTVVNPGPKILMRIRQEALETFLAYDTGSQRIKKIRELEAGKFLVFAQNPDKVFIFENEELTLLADLDGAEGATAVTDVALIGDKLYYLDIARLIAYDIDPLTGSRQRTMNISPHGEIRRPYFVEAISEKLLAVFVDDELEEAQTLCVSLATNQFNDAWTLDDVATLAWSDGVDLWVACGGDLYKSAAGGEPTLAGSFTSDIAAIHADSESTVVGLEDGSVHVKTDGEWEEKVLPGADAIAAVTKANLSFEFMGLLWGKIGVAELFGQDSAGGYDVSRDLGEYSGVEAQPSAVTALARFLIEGEDDNPSTSENESTPNDERVLVGTEGGVLLTLFVSPLSGAGAWLHSSILDEQCGIVARPIPEEDEEEGEA